MTGIGSCFRTSFVLVLLGCAGSDPRKEADPRFVRGGVLVSQTVPPGARPAGPDRGFVPSAWTPGERGTWDGVEVVAPGQAECVALYSVDLGDVSRHVAAGGEAPDTALAWSPHGDRLAVGSFTGEILVIDGGRGKVLARRRLAETMVKSLLWSADGGTLYAGEQSPDAWLLALDPNTLTEKWKFRAARELGESPLPDSQDIYGQYALPGIFDLQRLDDTGLLVTGAHGWMDPEGTRHNLTRLWRMGPDGEVLAAWPPAGPTSRVTYHPRVDRKAGLVAAGMQAGLGAEHDNSATVHLLRLLTLEPVQAFQMEPLGPHFSSTFLWESVDIDVASDTLIAGAGDGRLRRWRVSDGSHLDLGLGTPIDTGTVPIAASLGFARLWAGGSLSVTSGTTIPWGAAAPDTRPPTLHPRESTLFAHTTDGTLRWVWHGEERLNGLVLSEDGETAVVGAGLRSADEREDLFGALLFRLLGEGSGEQRLLARCHTSSPIFFRPAISRDGVVAMAEHPWKRNDGAIVGTYRVTVAR